MPCWVYKRPCQALGRDHSDPHMPSSKYSHPEQKDRGKLCFPLFCVGDDEHTCHVCVMTQKYSKPSCTCWLKCHKSMRWLYWRLETVAFNKLAAEASSRLLYHWQAQAGKPATSKCPRSLISYVWWCLLTTEMMVLILPNVCQAHPGINCKSGCTSVQGLRCISNLAVHKQLNHWNPIATSIKLLISCPEGVTSLSCCTRPTSSPLLSFWKRHSLAVFRMSGFMKSRTSKLSSSQLSWKHLDLKGLSCWLLGFQLCLESYWTCWAGCCCCSRQVRLIMSGQLSDVSSAAICQLSCHLSTLLCNLSAWLSAQLQLVCSSSCSSGIKLSFSYNSPAAKLNNCKQTNLSLSASITVLQCWKSVSSLPTGLPSSTGPTECQLSLYDLQACFNSW